MLRVGEKVFPRKELTSWLLSTKWSALKIQLGSKLLQVAYSNYDQITPHTEQGSEIPYWPIGLSH